MLLIESECDEVIPRTVIASYLEAFDRARSFTYRVLAKADHGLTQETAQRAYSALLLNWLTELALPPQEVETPQAQTVATGTGALPEAPPGPG